MSRGRTVRPIWIITGLIFGFAAVLAGPVYIVWNTFFASAVSEGDLNAVFQSVRYESGGLVFRYTVRNRTRHSVQFQPTLTEIKALQPKDRPAVGYPNIILPFTLPGRASHVIEVRLELPSSAGPPASMSDEQTREVLQSQPPGEPASPDPPGSQLPMQGPIAPSASPALIEMSLEEALAELSGFVVEDETDGIRLVLPRGW